MNVLDFRYIKQMEKPNTSFEAEINRRTWLGWSALGKYSDTF